MAKQKITERQRIIIQLIAEGKNDAEIAQVLGITLNTLRSYLRVLFPLANAENRCQLVAWGFRNKILK